MRFKWCAAVIVFSGLSSIFGEDDPCTTSMELHSIDGRSPTSTVDIPCDAYISKGWYKTPRYDMITFNPGIGKCGSIFPIYLKESLTDNLDIQDMDACMIGPGDDCVQTIPIRVKKCEEDRAYYLTPTKSCQSTYCFNISREYTDPAPTWIPKTISVSTEIDFEKQTPEYFFRCDFDMAPEPLLYKIYWYVNSKKIRDTGFIHKDKIPTKGYLLERHLLTKRYKLNIMIACAVVATKSHKGEPGTLQKSKDFFAGIKVLTNSVKIKEGESANAVIIPTIPLPCPIYLPTCEYQIWMYEWSQKEYQCKKQVNIGSSNRCGTIINGKYKDDKAWFTNKEWNKSVTMEIRHRSSNKFPKKSHYTLQLRVAETQFNKLLENTLIDDISVVVSAESPDVFKQKVCYGLVDPHMRTFDGNQFEMHISGGFLMYRNKKYNTMVQVKTTECYSTSSNIQCICGIVIRAGRDVFMIYMCPDLTTKIDQFIRCHDGLLTATSKGSSEYQVVFEYNKYHCVGTEVESNCTVFGSSVH